MFPCTPGIEARAAALSRASLFLSLSLVQFTDLQSLFQIKLLPDRDGDVWLCVTSNCV